MLAIDSSVNTMQETQAVLALCKVKLWYTKMEFAPASEAKCAAQKLMESLPDWNAMTTRQANTENSKLCSNQEEQRRPTWREFVFLASCLFASLLR